MTNLRKAALKWIKDWEVPEEQRENCIADFEAGVQWSIEVLNESRPHITFNISPPPNDKLVLLSMVPGIAAGFLSQHANESAPEGE